MRTMEADTVMMTVSVPINQLESFQEGAWPQRTPILRVAVLEMGNRGVFAKLGVMQDL